MDDVEFVVIGLDVGLVESGCVGLLGLCVDFIVGGFGEEGVYRDARAL